MVDYSITFQAANICASCGKYSQPVNTLLRHTELKVFGNVCYIAFGSLSFAIDTCVLVNCFKPEKQKKKMYASVSAETEAKKQEEYHPGC